ncbi:uncharacterized protein LOC123891888 [Trifolium pratense]|uniref:uncharacterized protein LOC123891888 n=1 Tax=Trifolium pratense TaxID=57577 RepID=UPI001E6980CE|nr:uncharacterized protein LOC123891888 [Trifolium pratense]
MAFFKAKEEQVSLKLLVNTETNKVLFAEAEKDFVDILCSFLTLPLGTIASLLQKESNMGPVTIGCLNKLYRSVENLRLLPSNNSSEDYCRTLKINIDDTQPTKYFMCSKFNDYNYRYHHYLTTGTNKLYCSCGNRLNRSVSLAQLCNGFVKDAATFIVTDNLTVLPHSMDHTLFGLINNLGMQSTSLVKEMTVNVTKKKVLDLLKCSLLSKTPLTDLFLGMKPSIASSRILSYDVKNVIDGGIYITVKLVVRKSSNTILFAQGGQDFADLIIRFLTFPLGGVLRKLEGNSSLGSMDGLYRSIANLNEDNYFKCKEARNRLLTLSVLHYYCYYRFDARNKRIFDAMLFKRDDEDRSNDGNFRKMKLVNTISSMGSPYGQVNRPEMYVVTDDLVVEPLLSPISSLYLLNRFEIPLSDLKEQVVVIGMKESLSILKAALTSTSALTNGLRHLLTKVKAEE